ncbi:MAG TPA: hypothetical protein DEQ38_04360 [Elusimicrobia bacterium]|nr:MAG: hypothetical protein A2089_06000 [Elusimicrobia bacterium GWD2_63_28]HCC47337.1 hypothetical protein [Elusimicrobiota bacterium]
MRNRLNISPKNILLLLAGGALAAAVLGSALLLAARLWPSFQARTAKREATAVMVKEAKALGLTYETVVAAPAQAMGKPALWCLRRSGADEALYKGQEKNRLRITNPAAMYNYSGSSHQACVDTVVTIQNITASEYLGARGLRLEVTFVDYY